MNHLLASRLINQDLLLFPFWRCLLRTYMARTNKAFAVAGPSEAHINFIIYLSPRPFGPISISPALLSFYKENDSVVAVAYVTKTSRRSEAKGIRTHAIIIFIPLDAMDYWTLLRAKSLSGKHKFSFASFLWDVPSLVDVKGWWGIVRGLKYFYY